MKKTRDGAFGNTLLFYSDSLVKSLSYVIILFIHSFNIVNKHVPYFASIVPPARHIILVKHIICPQGVCNYGQ